MPEETKYSLSPISEEEKNTFMKEFQEFLNKHSLYFEPVPYMQRKSLTDPWEVSAQILLQKKTEVLAAEAMPETDSVISPLQSDDLEAAA